MPYDILRLLSTSCACEKVANNAYCTLPRATKNMDKLVQLLIDCGYIVSVEKFRGSYKVSFGQFTFLDKSVLSFDQKKVVNISIFHNDQHVAKI